MSATCPNCGRTEPEHDGTERSGCVVFWPLGEPVESWGWRNQQALMNARRTGVTRAEFDAAMDAIWSELAYQDALPRRTDDEAKDVQGFATLARVYMRRLEDHWADLPGPIVEPALDDLRKLAAIFARAMVYCGVRVRRPLPDSHGP